MRNVWKALILVLTAPSLAGIGALIAGSVPGVQNLQAWVFPLIMFHTGVTLLLFVIAIRLALPKSRDLGELVAMRYEGTALRDKWLNPEAPERLPEMNSEHDEWHASVMQAIGRIDEIEAGLWRTFDIYVPAWVRKRNVSERMEGNQLKALNEWTEQLRTLKDVIDRLRR